MEWQWRNDPDGLPDDELQRCIGAPGERLLVYGAELFGMITCGCGHVTEHADAPAAGDHSYHQLNYKGLHWVHGLLTRTWRSRPFDSGPQDAEARYSAGLELLAAVALEMGSMD